MWNPFLFLQQLGFNSDTSVSPSSSFTLLLCLCFYKKKDNNKKNSGGETSLRPLNCIVGSVNNHYLLKNLLPF